MGAFLYKVLLENKTKCKEKRPVKVEISVSEIVEVFKEIQGNQGRFWRWFGPICQKWWADI